MGVTIVAAGEGDHDLWAEAVARFRGVRHDRDAAFLADPATVAFVAEDGGEVVGWAWGFGQRRPDGATMLLLYELEVVEPARRRGVGRSLVDAFLELARAEGHAKMWLITDEENEAAKALYESTGGRRSDKDDVGYWWQIADRA